MGNELDQGRGDTPAQLSIRAKDGEPTLVGQRIGQKRNRKRGRLEKKSEITKHDEWIDELERLCGFKLEDRPRLEPRLRAAKEALDFVWTAWHEETKSGDLFLHVIELAERMIYAAGLENWRFKLEDSKKWIGRCEKRSSEIMMTRSFVEREYHENPRYIREVILHEIAHAIDPSMPRRRSHDAMWREIAISIGSNGERYLHRD